MGRRQYDDDDHDEDESEYSESESSLIDDAGSIDEETVDLESLADRPPPRKGRKKPHHDDDDDVSEDSASGSEDESVDSPKGKGGRYAIRDRGGRNTANARRQIPPRNKTFDSSSGDGRRSKAPPPRSKSELGGYGRQQSARSLGGPRMRRESSQRQLTVVQDKDARENARARRLRAVGQKPAGFDGFRRSQSFSNRSSGSKLALDSDHSKDGTEGAGDDKKDDADGGEKSQRGERKQLPPRSNSNISITDEERQYARTAARGITRSKSLRGQKLNIGDTTKSVASKLQALGVRSEHGTPGSTAKTNSSSGSRRVKRGESRQKQQEEKGEEKEHGGATETKTADETPDSPKAVAAGLSW